MTELTDSADRMPPIGTMAHCAKVLGVSSPYLSKLKKEGRISPGPDGQWNPDAVRAQIAETRDPRNILATIVRNQAAVPEADRAAAAAAVSSPDELTDEHIASLYSHDHKLNLLIARSLKEREQAAQARIDRLEAEKKLCLVEDVARKSFTAGRAVRDSIMRAVTKIAPILAPMSDTWEIERRLADAMRSALSEAADNIRQGAGTADADH